MSAQFNFPNKVIHCISLLNGASLNLPKGKSDSHSSAILRLNYKSNGIPIQNNENIVFEKPVFGGDDSEHDVSNDKPHMIRHLKKIIGGWTKSLFISRHAMTWLACLNLFDIFDLHIQVKTC